MCNYKVWFHDEKAGYIVECKKCNKLRVCFGNVLLNMQHKDFQKFYQYVSEVTEEKKHLIDSNEKSVILATPCAAMSIILTPDELNGLYRMIDHADSEMKAASMIKMFAE